MKLLFFVVNQSPFNIELVDHLYNYLPKGSSVKIILQNKMELCRSQWGLKTCTNPIEIHERPRKLELFLEQEKPEVVVYTSYRSSGFMKAKRWARKHGVKFFVQCSEKLIEYKRSSFFIWLKYQLFKYRTSGVNGITAAGNRAMDLYQKHCGAPCLCVPYTFDMTRLLDFRPLPYDGKNLVFLISGRLEPFRDPIYSIRLFSDLKKMKPDINMNLIISGKGSLYDTIIKLLKEMKIEDCTTWINEFGKWEEIHEIYNKAHVLLCMQEYGGWGLIVPEAMASGLLVAGSSGVDSVDTYIVDGYNGLYCNRKDYNTILSSIIEIVSDKDRFEQVRYNARETIKYGDVKYYAKRMASFIQKH